MTVDGLQGFAFQTEAFSADLLARASSAFTELLRRDGEKGVSPAAGAGGGSQRPCLLPDSEWNQIALAVLSDKLYR